eukprot:TRINITY_DN10106_c0_g1_i1.p1 TRINITY_DN10106_c0_g1~~TRINITY_DN10106_c0_g1_i1.p1  ORF type:complete len:315 (-),score=82.79 TRINITY_DN10106_c0_g1_i1:55-966(-)
MAHLFHKLDFNSDIINKDFPKSTVDSKSTVESDLSLNSSLTLKSSETKVVVKANRNNDGSTGSSATCTRTINDNLKLEINGDTKFDLGAKLTATDLGTKGTELSLSGQNSQKKGTSLHFNAVYKNDNVALDFKVGHSLSSKTDITASGVYKFNDYSMGLSGGYVVESDDHKFSDCALKVQYEQENYTGVFYSKFNLVEDDDQTIGFGYNLKMNPKCEAVTQFEFGNTSTATVGVQYQLDDNSKLKTKVLCEGNNQLRTGLHYSHKVNDDVEFSFGTDLNTKKLFNGESSTDPHRFAFAIDFFG